MFPFGSIKSLFRVVCHRLVVLRCVLRAWLRRAVVPGAIRAAQLVGQLADSEYLDLVREVLDC